MIVYRYRSANFVHFAQSFEEIHIFLLNLNKIRDFIQWLTENNYYLFLSSLIKYQIFFRDRLKKSSIFFMTNSQTDLKKFHKRNKFADFQETLKYTCWKIIGLCKNLQGEILHSIFQYGGLSIYVCKLWHSIQHFKILPFKDPLPLKELLKWHTCL